MDIPEENKESDPLKQIMDRLVYVESLVHYQGACLEALEGYFGTQLIRDGHANAREEIQRIKRKVYDAHIESIEKSNPRLAADLDIRKHLDAGDEYTWRVAE